jgi:hypothetical protein
MTLGRFPAAGLLLGLATVGACTSVRIIQPTTFLADHAPPVVWVTYRDSTVVSVADPEVRRDTLRGTLEGARVKIPLAQIETVQAKVHDGTKTALLVGTLGIAAVSGLYFGSISKSGSNTGGAVYCGVNILADPILYC